MLTGHQAFEGDDPQDVLSRILQREPEWSKLPSSVPSRVGEVLRGSLEKDLKNRRRDMGDVRIDLEHALKETKEIAVARLPVRGSRFAWVLLSVLGLLVVVLSIPTALYLRARSVESPEMRLDISTPPTPQPLHFAISPDGMRLVFVASGTGSQQLWLRTLNTATAQPLAGTEGAEYPFWSPDSRSVGFFAGSKLKRLKIGVGPPEILADAPTGRGGTWSGDGTILFAPTNASPLWRVPASGGSPPVQVTKLDLPRTGSHLSLLKTSSAF